MQNETNNAVATKKCSVINRCGGCQIQHYSYEKQLEEKQKQVNNLIGKYCKVENIIGMVDPYYYRNKVHAVFDTDKKGNVISGVYEAGSHRVVPVDSCLIEDQRADNIIVTIRKMLKSFKIRTYDEDSRMGLLRHVLIRTGHKSGEIMVVLVLASHIFPSKNNFIKALLKSHPEITTIVMNVNNKKTSMVLGEREQVLYGKGFIEDTLCEKVFRISPKSFYQINPTQTEILYGKAIELAELKGNETVIDAYCGIGTIGIIASDHAKKVVGVELNRDAVKDAITNTKRNKVKNVFFYNMDAGDFMDQMAHEKQTADVVFLDPPRSGSTEKFLDSMISIQPKKIVYISCNPETLERDLSYLVKRGYEAKIAVPVDMFPGTEQVETVVSLSHKKVDTHININVEFGDDEGQIPIDEIVRKAEEYRPSERVTYKMMQEYIESKYNFKVHTAYIAEVKRDLGLPMYDAPNAVEELKQERKHPTPEKVEAIKDALKHFGVCQ